MLGGALAVSKRALRRRAGRESAQTSIPYEAAASLRLFLFFSVCDFSKAERRPPMGEVVAAGDLINLGIRSCWVGARGFGTRSWSSHLCGADVVPNSLTSPHLT